MPTTIIYPDGRKEVVQDPDPGTPPVPVEIDSWRGKLVLARTKKSGQALYDLAEAIIEASDAETRAFWFTPQWRRDHEKVTELGSALGLAPSDIDALFIEATAAA